MSRFDFYLYRRGLALQLFGLWILLGRFGNVHNPCIHMEFPFNSGRRGRLFRIAYRTSIGTESTIHIRYGQKGIDYWTKQPYRCWRIDVDSDHYAHWVIRFADKHPRITQYKMLWEDEHGCEVETRLLGIEELATCSSNHHRSSAQQCVLERPIAIEAPLASSKKGEILVGPHVVSFNFFLSHIHA